MKKNERHKKKYRKSNMYFVEITEAGEKGQKKYFKR